ncbi:MAG: hypothetical protein FWG22_01855, partial [Prolixibacteraceae bacterium]|nr:hypothetical protein [Prolixibacteraceae bacterium]
MPETITNSLQEDEAPALSRHFYAFVQTEEVSGNNYLTQNDNYQDTPVPSYPSAWQIKARRERELQKMYVNGEPFLPVDPNIVLETHTDAPQSLVLPSKTLVHTNDDWFILIFFGIMILFASVKYLFESYIENIFL